MALFAKPNDPPPESDGALSYVLWVAKDVHGCVDASPSSAVHQDLDIYGLDVEDFAAKLGERYGPGVFDWPWHRFAELGEGLSLLFPFILVKQLVTWPFRGQFSYPESLERLELGHIAKVLEKGEWIDP
ncbi:hypothetical protein QWY75_02960 [Pontixanthobacter aestiaquae]|uniref:Acyl carrier protein n=1 Tax=Pontixanthobacter aestiaquae TaxID=1509367 RepID=A0A844Z9G1_9SPHN|nr:hypothetical protein [Pontixanthobacter aestiaquae]MDN3645164.1 hypothetical protein [Pontixanthobacter aestiaquae]MXO83836.1 hypothetical protein [Pontixanthobacter aestiaquae]